MSYEIHESSRPIPHSELSSDLNETFVELVFKLYELDQIHEDLESIRSRAIVDLHQSLQREIRAHPLLAQVTLNGSTLLDIVCQKVGSAGQETIRFLIEANPHALVHRQSDDVATPLHFLAGSGWASDWLLWIVERYPWVFQHKACQQFPPHLEMMSSYVTGRCELETVRRFYELYPKGLRERNESSTVGYPLSASLRGTKEPDADFFIWMARQYPAAVYFELTQVPTVLQFVCFLLASTKCTPNMARICRFLISEHPDTVRQLVTGFGYLPIHMLAPQCHRPLVQEMVILLLKAYPECLQQVNGTNLSSFAFILEVKPLVLEELEIDQEISLLGDLSANVRKVIVSPANHFASESTGNGSVANVSLLESVSEVFCSWADLQVKKLNEQRKRLQEQIMEMCRRFETDDVSEASADVVDWEAETESEDSEDSHLFDDEDDD